MLTMATGFMLPKSVKDRHNCNHAPTDSITPTTLTCITSDTAAAVSVWRAAVP